MVVDVKMKTKDEKKLKSKFEDAVEKIKTDEEKASSEKLNEIEEKTEHDSSMKMEVAKHISAKKMKKMKKVEYKSAKMVKVAVSKLGNKKEVKFWEESTKINSVYVLAEDNEVVDEVMLLEEFEVWELVTRGYEEPQDEDDLTEEERATYKELFQKDNTAKCLIYDRIDERTFEQIMWEPNAKKIWDRLEKTFAKNVEKRKEAVTDDDSVKKIEAEYSSVEELKTLDEIIEAEFNLTEYGKAKDATEDDDVGEEPEINLYEEDVESEFDDAFDVEEESEEVDVTGNNEDVINLFEAEEEIDAKVGVKEVTDADVIKKGEEEDNVKETNGMEATKEKWKEKIGLFDRKLCDQVKMGNFEIGDWKDKLFEFYGFNRDQKCGLEFYIFGKKMVKEKEAEANERRAQIRKHSRKRYADNKSIKVKKKKFFWHEENDRFTQKHERKKLERIDLKENKFEGEC